MDPLEPVFVICLPLVGYLQLQYQSIKSNKSQKKPICLLEFKKIELSLAISKCSYRTWESIASIGLFSTASSDAWCCCADVFPLLTWDAYIIYIYLISWHNQNLNINYIFIAGRQLPGFLYDIFCYVLLCHTHCIS